MLRSGDDRSAFRSGDIELDRFFQRYAGQNQYRHYIGTTYIAEVEGCIAGFVTISSGEMTTEQLQSVTKKRLPDYPIPVLRMARMAVDERHQGLRLGERLLQMVLELAADMRNRFGCVGVVVDAKPKAVAYYERYGFIRLETVAGELGDRPQPAPMFLSMHFIIKALSKRGQQSTNTKPPL